MKKSLHLASTQLSTVSEADDEYGTVQTDAASVIVQFLKHSEPFINFTMEIVSELPVITQLAKFILE